MNMRQSLFWYGFHTNQAPTHLFKNYKSGLRSEGERPVSWTKFLNEDRHEQDIKKMSVEWFSLVGKVFNSQLAIFILVHFTRWRQKLLGSKGGKWPPRENR